ncbi:MAG: PD-(D/E)XK nuclease family protein [Gammaproteobacteria bacterium]
MQLIPIVEQNAELLEGKKEKQIGIYYASEIDSCLRKNYYTYFEKAHYKYNTHKAFSIGNALHELIQNIFITYAQKYNGIQVENERKDMTYKDPLTNIEIHGRLDSLIIDKSNNKIHIIEIKTTSNLKFTPIKEHFDQLNYYLYFNPDINGKFHPFNLDEEINPKVEGHLFYINTAKKKYNDDNYLEFKEFPKSELEKPILFDKDLFQAFILRARVLDAYLKNKQIPLPEAKMSSEMYWQCESCPYRAKCDREDNERNLGKELYAELVAKYSKKKELK